jgi:hypothetical protein
VELSVENECPSVEESSNLLPEESPSSFKDNESIETIRVFPNPLRDTENNEAIGDFSSPLKDAESNEAIRDFSSPLKDNEKIEALSAEIKNLKVNIVILSFVRICSFFPVISSFYVNNILQHGRFSLRSGFNILDDLFYLFY